MAEQRAHAREGLVKSWVTHGSQIAERVVATTFNVVRDVRGDLGQRVSRRIDWIDANQQSRIKLARGINDRVNKLAEEMIDFGENIAQSLIHAARDTGYGVSNIATRATESLSRSKAKEGPRAAA